jgi:hypothetical protein
MSSPTPRPEIVEDSHLKFLDSLRDSGVTNMYGAAPYLQDAYGLSRPDSRIVLAYWMASFSERHP